MTTLIKFYKTSCGPCGKMNHYDHKVAAELGHEFIKVQVGSYDFREKWSDVLYRLYPNGRGVGWPTYVLIDGNTPDSTIIGQVRGAMEKGRFREKLKEAGEPLPYGCSHESEGKGTSGSAEYWADVYSNCKLTRSEVTKGSAPRPPKSDERRGKYRQWISNDKPGEDYGNGSHIFHLSDKDTEDGGSSGGGGGNDCDDWKLVVDCPGPGNEGDPLRISAKGEGINDSNLTFKWYIGDDKQGEGSTYNGVYPKCGTSVTFRCVVRKTSCDSSHNKEKTCTVTSNPCGGGDPCAGVSCPPGQVCQNGVCVDDGSGSGNPCLPNPCPNGEACMTNGDGTYQCIPTDPCAGVSCPPCHTCINGICIDRCSNGQICDGGVCKDPDPCAGVNCNYSNCEYLDLDDCQCKSKCGPNEVCDGSGNCVPINPPDPCDGVDCPDGHVCIDGNCVDTDPCAGVDCPDCHECKDGICIDQCTGGQICKDGACACPDGEILDSEGNCVPDPGPCKDIICAGGKMPEESGCDENGFNCTVCECVCPPGLEEDVNGICYDPTIDPPDPPDESGDGRFIPRIIAFQCCPVCPDMPPEFEEGDNGDCDKRPTPDPVPGADEKDPVYLYDRLNHTFSFCCPIQTDVTWLMKFDTIPPVFQRYITTAAAVRAAAQIVDNPQLFQLLKDREQMLRMACSNYELEQGDLNFLGQPDYSTYYGYQPFQTLQR